MNQIMFMEYSNEIIKQIDSYNAILINTTLFLIFEFYYS